MNFEDVICLSVGLAVFGLGLEIGFLFGGSSLLAVIMVGLFCGWGGFCLGLVSKEVLIDG